jgi:phosphohistidine phosphatase
MEKFVVLLRHGIAEPRGTGPEETRPLTDEGHKKMKENARGLARLFSKAEAIISSPLKRAVQTAEHVVKAFDGKLKLQTSDALRPESDALAVRKLIDEIGATRLILVGHEPNLTEAMLHRTKMHADDGLELKKGGCYGVRIEEDGTAHVEWMLPPRVLRGVE